MINEFDGLISATGRGAGMILSGTDNELSFTGNTLIFNELNFIIILLLLQPGVSQYLILCDRECS